MTFVYNNYVTPPLTRPEVEESTDVLQDGFNHTCLPFFPKTTTRSFRLQANHQLRSAVAAEIQIRLSRGAVCQVPLIMVYAAQTGCYAFEGQASVFRECPLVGEDQRAVVTCSYRCLRNQKCAIYLYTGHRHWESFQLSEWSICEVLVFDST